MPKLPIFVQLCRCWCFLICGLGHESFRSAVGSRSEKKSSNISRKYQVNKPIGKHQMSIILIIERNNAQKVWYIVKKLLSQEKWEVVMLKLEAGNLD